MVTPGVFFKDWFSEGDFMRVKIMYIILAVTSIETTITNITELVSKIFVYAK